MANNPFDPKGCEEICSIIKRMEIGKKEFKILNSDFKYDPATNTYTGTFMEIQVSGQNLTVSSENIVITPSTNTLIFNFAWDGTDRIASITTEQKTVSEVSELMISNTYTSAGSTCSFSIPIQLDGKGTSGGETLCEQLKEDLITIPHFITRPSTFSYNNGTWTVNGKIVVQKGQNTFEKDIVNFTGTGNNLFLKIYASSNNFDLEARQFGRPIDVEDFVKNNTSDCIYYIPIGYGDGTNALQHYVHAYDVFMGQFKELIITRHYDQNMAYTGRVFRIGGNTQGSGVRAGFRNNSFFKPNHDNRAMIVSTSGNSFISDNINNSETGITLPNTNFTHSKFQGSFGTSQNSFETRFSGVGTSDNGQFRETLEGSMTVGNGEIAKSFFIKNVLSVPVSVRLESITRGLIWLITS
jgi:hypothetical protein